MRIKDISVENRPRERLLSQGASALSDAELLALIFKTGNIGENVVDMSNRLLSQYGMEKLSDLSLTELQSVKGIGPAKAMQIVALFELNRRHAKARKGKIKKIRNSKDVFKMYGDELKNKKKEVLYCVLLDSKNQIIGHEQVSIGTLNESLIHPREVFRRAIKESACSIILIHNHPSGDPTPSIEDREVTNKIRETGNIIGIDLIDHVIIGGNSYKSLL